MKFRLVAYTPFTEEKWPLPSPLSYSVVYVLNSLHSLEFTYPDSQSAANVITPDKGYPYEYSVEYFNPATETWDEPLGSRFIGMKVSSDQIEEMPTKKYSNLSLKWLFRKAKVWSTGGVAGSDERVFKDVTIGSILITLFTEAYKRGIKVTNPSNIGFTDKVDSSGTSWGGTVSMAFPINMSLEEVLNDLAEQGFIDWDMQGRRTLVWKADSSAGLARDKRSIYLQNVTGTTSAPEEVSFESMMTTARVLGETQSWEYSNNLSSPWGRLEDVVSQSGVIDPITAKEASEKILLEGERPIKTHTKELSGHSSLQPLIDVRIGDWVRGQTNRDRTKPTSFEDMRIQEISLDVTGSDYTWNVSMGDRRSDMLEKIARRQNALSGGSSGGTSRTPSGGTAQTGDWRVPTTPTNFSVRIDSHLDADTNRYKGRAVFTWFDDHMGLDKYDNSLSPQARRGYEVSYRVAGTTNWTTLAWYGPDADKSPQIYYPLDVINPATNRPYTYEFRLRTLGAETYSPYTTAVAVQAVADQEAPEKPTKPTTEASLGVITVSWDKKTASGKSMPLDFSHLIVESRHYADTEVIKEVGQIYGNSLPLVGLTEGVPYQFRFVAVDTAGNRSDPSDWSVATVIQPLVDTKSIQDALTSANDALDAAVKETESRLADLNKHMSESFGEIDDDIQTVWSAINSPDVFAQPEAPNDPKEGQLWIDTDNSNKLYRWSSSGNWDPVSDTSAAEALAKTIPTVIHSTTVVDPASSAANGSTWFQHLPSITSPVVAQWTKENGKWVPVTVSSEVIANLDVGKLTAGSASLSTAVVDKLFANIFAAKKISASEMTIAPSSEFPDPLFQSSYGYAPWTVVGGGIEMEGSGRQSGIYFSSLEVAVSPGDEYIISFDKDVYPDTNRGSNTALYARYSRQDGTMISEANHILSHNSGDVGTKSGSWVVPEGVYKVRFGFFLQASVVEGTRIRISNPKMVRRVGGILIKDGGVTAEHVTASKSLTAKMAQFLTVTSDMITANAITASHLTAGSVQAQHMNFQGPLVNGEGYQLVIDSTGIKFYFVSGAAGESSAEPDRKLVTALTGESAGENGALYSIVDRSTGMTLASMTEGGDVNGVQGNFENDISIGGVPLASPGGLLDDFPRGAIPGSAVATDLRGTVKPPGEWGFAEVSLLADPDRVYRINTESFILKVTGARDMRYTIRFTYDGSMPTVNSPVLRHYFDSRDPATTGTNYHQMGGTSTLFRPKSNNSDTAPKEDGKVLYRFLFCVYRGHTNLEFIGGDAGPFVAWIEDIGPDLMYAGTDRNSFKAFESPTTTDSPAPAPSKSLYTKTYSVASHKNFYVDFPGPVSKGEYVWSTYTRDNLFFGGFDSRNLWSFATMSSMTSNLSGADIKSIKASFKVSDTYAYSGANVGVWIHGYSSYGSQSPSSLGNYIKTISGAKEGSTYSVTIPSQYFPMFKSGGIKGIAFGFNSHVKLPLNGRIQRSSIKFTISYYK